MLHSDAIELALNLAPPSLKGKEDSRGPLTLATQRPYGVTRIAPKVPVLHGYVARRPINQAAE